MKRRERKIVKGRKKPLTGLTQRKKGLVPDRKEFRYVEPQITLLSHLRGGRKRRKIKTDHSVGGGTGEKGLRKTTKKRQKRTAPRGKRGRYL